MRQSNISKKYDDINKKYKIVIDEIHEIEMTNNKDKRERWRELQKIKKWLESELRKFSINYILPNI